MDRLRRSMIPGPHASRSAAAAVAVIVVVAVLASCQSDDAPRGGLASAPGGPATPVSSNGDLAPRYRDALDTLGRQDSSDEAKLALIEHLATDSEAGATTVLLTSTTNPSMLVSMASIRALSGRPCEIINDPLERLLDDQEWQRRAWAAKILGDTRCRAALLHLSERLQRERDGRVQQRIEAAITALNEGGKG